MGYREFADADGLTWKVWDVKPASRVVAGRQQSTESDGTSTPAEGERAPTPHVTVGWEGGWLAFQSHDMNRRLRPIPSNWEGESEDTLRRYLLKAEVKRPTPTGTQSGVRRG